MDTYTPEQAAAIVGNVSASTVRNWCKVYAEVLSAGANPPTGTERRLTQEDVAILQQVKLLRDNRMPPNVIVATLQQAATTPAPLTIDATPTPSTSAQDAHSDALLLPVVVDTINKRIDTTDARVDDLQQAITLLEQRQAARINALITGIVIGGTAVLSIVGLVLAMGR